MNFANKIICGDALTAIKKMPDGFVDMCITSPPYWGLRDYQCEPIIWDGDEDCNHEWNDKIMINKRGIAGTGNTGNHSKIIAGQDIKQEQGQFCIKCNAWQGQLGLEPSFDLYIKHLCTVFDEVKRVLKDEGSLWVNIADSYAGAGGMGSWVDNKASKGMNIIKDYHRQNVEGIKNKSLVGIPELFAIEMTHRRGWIRRNTIIWHKNNCMPSSAKDRFTVDFEYLYFFTKQGKYYFEQQFEKSVDPESYTGRRKRNPDKYVQKGQGAIQNWDREGVKYPNRNKRCVWKIPTKPYSEAHYAVFPEELIETPIKAGCPEFVCKKCGKERKKKYNKKTTFHSGSGKSGNIPKGKWKGKEQQISGDYDIRMGPKVEITEKDLTNCGCEVGFKSGLVLDPFIGSGTTARVAISLGRNYLGIDIQDKYLELSNKRTSNVQVELFR